MRRPLTLSALALALAGIGLLGIAPRARAGAAALALSPARAAAPATAAAATAREARYALDYRHQVTIEGRALPPTVVKGIWTATTPLGAGGDRAGVTLGSVEVSGLHDAPPAADMAHRFEIAADPKGRLSALGFSADTPAKARGLLGTLACAFQFSPGEGDTWTAEEQDRTGTYEAVYQRRGDEVIRTRARFTALRGPAGLDPTRAGAVQARGAARFHLDAEGVREIIVDEQIAMTLIAGMKPVVVHVEATLRRLGAREIALASMDPLPLEAPRAHGQAGDGSGHDHDRALLGGAGVDDVLAEVARVQSIPASAGDREATWRTDAFLKTRALLRVHPESASAVSRAVENSGDHRALSVLAGALGEAGTDEANRELLRLLSTDLPDGARDNVLAAMALSRTPSAESAAALTDALSSASAGGAAALALGAQARTLADSDPGPAADAVAELIARYQDAQTDDERLVYLSALANSGAREALPLMREALDGDTPSLAQAAAYGLRFIPGGDVDALLTDVIAGAPRPVKIQAIRATAYRDRSVWQPRLTAARAGEPAADVRAAMDKVLARWR